MMNITKLIITKDITIKHVTCGLFRIGLFPLMPISNYTSKIFYQKKEGVNKSELENCWGWWTEEREEEVVAVRVRIPALRPNTTSPASVSHQPLNHHQSPKL